MRTEQWIRTDEAEDVAGSVRHCLHSYRLVSTDDQAWKWVALSLHSALQGACVCHLTTTAVPLGAVNPNNAKEWFAYFEESRTRSEAKRPETRLMGLPQLLEKIRKPRSAGDGSNELGVHLTDSELQWLTRFHDRIRNDFTHFSPKGWSIEVSGIPQLTLLTSRIIREIANLGWAFRHQNSAWQETLRADLGQLEQAAT